LNLPQREVNVFFRKEIVPNNALNIKLNPAKIIEDDRKSIFEAFWKNMTWEEQKVYVNAHVATNENAVKIVGDTSRRNRSFVFFVRKNNTRDFVSKRLFPSTLGIGEKTYRVG